MPVRDKINQLNEHCWFTNMPRQKRWKGILVSFNLCWVHRILGIKRIKQVKVNFTFHIRENLSKQEIC